MILSINQPAYLPWLGYFERILKSDRHVVLDHVQFEKNSFVNRNKIRTTQAWTWLTVPVRTKGTFGNIPINRLEINRSVNWQRKHWESIRQSYSKAPFFDLYAEDLQAIYSRDWRFLIEICEALFGKFTTWLGITVPVLRSSELSPQLSKDELVLEICQKLNAQSYLSGPLGRNYIREPLFEEAGIRVAYHDFAHPEYPQVHGQPFMPGMCVLDLLFNCGAESRRILSGNRAAAMG